MDYKKLLKKYIEHVGASTGCTFINEDEYMHHFTGAEVEELVNLSDCEPHCLADCDDAGV
jgi:hypothetical protein